jgi:hypothetical protein
LVNIYRYKSVTTSGSALTLSGVPLAVFGIFRSTQSFDVKKRPLFFAITRKLEEVYRELFSRVSDVQDSQYSTTALTKPSSQGSRLYQNSVFVPPSNPYIHDPSENPQIYHNQTDIKTQEPVNEKGISYSRCS